MNQPDPIIDEMSEAHRKGDLAAVRQLLEEHPELEKTYPSKYSTWLHLAAEHCHVTILEFWLQRGWDVNLNAPGLTAAKGTYTALHCAKDAATTRYLLAQGASPNVCENRLGTPLHQAIVLVNEPSQKGRRRPEGADIEQVKALVEAGTDLSIVNEQGGDTPLAMAIRYRRKTAVQYLRDIGAPEKGQWPFKSKPELKSLDLCRDFDEIYAHLAKKVQKFSPKGRNVFGGPGPIKMIDVGFEYSQAAWLVVVFDTRPNAEPDGEWTALIEGNELKRPRWLEAFKLNRKTPLTIIQLDGSEAPMPENIDPAVILGKVVKAVVLKARADGLFATLPKAPGCELGVEHFEGSYGWPDYDDRKRDNLAEY